MPKESIKGLQPRRSFDPPERSRSCSGRIEASSAHTKCHIRKRLSFCTDHPNMSRSKNSPRPVSNRQSRRSRYQEIPEFSVRERVDSRAGEQKSKDHPNEKPALESRAGKPDQGTKCKTGSKRVTLLLRIRAQKTTKSCESPVPLCTVIRKRHLGEENDDVLITLRFKRRRGRTTRPKNAASDHNTAESPQDKKSDPTFKPSASTFQASS